MFSREPLNRRQFLACTAAAAAATAAGPLVRAAQSAPSGAKRFPVIAFTKPFRELNAADTAALVAEVGWDGVELPVRKKDGQITPEQVEDRLPEFVAALKKQGREVSIVTTDITSVTPLAEKVLRTASKLGVKRYRLGQWHYAKDQAIPEQLKTVAAQLRDLAALSKELGIQAGFQNHSGAAYIGAPVWDIWTMIKDLEPKSIGYCFDIGHATVEGGLSWRTHFRLAEPWLTAVFVKDFQWKKTAKGWRDAWCPLGDGMVDSDFFKLLAASSYVGPICQHHEYELGNRAEMIGYFKRDLDVLRRWLRT